MKYKIWKVSKGQHILVTSAVNAELAKRAFERKLDAFKGDGVEFILTADGVILYRQFS